MKNIWDLLKLIVVLSFVAALSYFIGLFPATAVFWTAVALTFLHLLFKDSL